MLVDLPHQASPACQLQGSVGGPLVNLDGQIVGMCAAPEAGAKGVSLAVPLQQVCKQGAAMMWRDFPCCCWLLIF